MSTLKEIKGKSYKDFELDELVEIQDLLEKKKFLTPHETGIWLGMPTRSVYKLINKGVIDAFHLYPGAQAWLIDTKETKKNLNER